MPGLPQRIDLLVPLQDCFFPEVDPDNAGVLPLGIRQVPQDTPQGLGEGAARVMGELAARCGRPCLLQGACPSPWSWAVPSRRQASWAPVGSWPHSSPWRCSARLGRSAHPPPAAEQCLGKGCPPGIAAAPSYPRVCRGVPSTPQPLTQGPHSGEVPKPFQPQQARAQSHTAAFRRWEMLLLQQHHAKAAASHQQLWPPSPCHSHAGAPRKVKLQLGLQLRLILWGAPASRYPGSVGPDTSVCTGGLCPHAILAEDADRTWT